jgi:N-methylhydantoinase B/oxoprolinase/acetone carboxylase alpha subunit
VNVDPITLEIFRNRLEAVADEMEVALVRSAVSTIIKEGGDASAGIFSPSGEMIAQAVAHPIHFGMLVPAVNRIIERFPPAEMESGDRFIVNDPYRGGTHAPDIAMVAPVIDEGRVIALAANMAHHQDVGGKTPGSLAADATEVFQEGLRFPPTRIMRDLELDPVVEGVFRSNVRLPDVLIGDLHAQSAACTLGQRRVAEAGRQLKLDVVETMRELVERTAAMARRRVAEIPDGRYTFVDYADNDGIVLDRQIAIHAALEVRGDEFVVDLTGSSGQVRGPVNCVEGMTMAVVYFIARTLLDPEVPTNAGCYQPVSAVLPPRSVVCAEPPAPVNLRIAIARRIYDAISGALLAADPSLARAASSNTQALTFGGRDPVTGAPFILLDVVVGGMGAHAHGDGVDMVYTDLTNQLGIPTEALEASTPIRVRRFELRQDSGGPGEQRGGLGCEKVYEVLADEVSLSIRGDRAIVPPWGCAGGEPAPGWETRIERASGEVVEVPSKIVLQLNRGDRVMVRSAGGGGFGHPFRRSVELVAEDVANERVSPDAAREQYGVIVSADGEVDRDATDQLRGERSNGSATVDPSTVSRGVVLAGLDVW